MPGYRCRVVRLTLCAGSVDGRPGIGTLAAAVVDSPAPLVCYVGVILDGVFLCRCSSVAEQPPRKRQAVSSNLTIGSLRAAPIARSGPSLCLGAASLHPLPLGGSWHATERVQYRSAGGGTRPNAAYSLHSCPRIVTFVNSIDVAGGTHSWDSPGQLREASVCLRSPQVWYGRHGFACCCHCS